MTVGDSGPEGTRPSRSRSPNRKRKWACCAEVEDEGGRSFRKTSQQNKPGFPEQGPNLDSMLLLGETPWRLDAWDTPARTGNL